MRRALSGINRDSAYGDSVYFVLGNVRLLQLGFVREILVSAVVYTKFLKVESHSGRVKSDNILVRSDSENIAIRNRIYILFKLTLRKEVTDATKIRVTLYPNCTF